MNEDHALPAPGLLFHGLARLEDKARLGEARCVNGLTAATASANRWGVLAPWVSMEIERTGRGSFFANEAEARS